MAIVRLTKLFKFEMAHALWGYDGPCKNIHGHSYELEVTISGSPVNTSESPKDGMLMDFGDLKVIVNKHIIDKYDHALVLKEGTPYAEFFSNQEHFLKIVFTPYQPTCENLIVDFAQVLQYAIPANIKLRTLRLRETFTSWAEWHSDENV